MKPGLKFFFGAILVAVVGLNIRAASMESILKIPKVVQKDPWFNATLVDAYAGFLIFYAWIAYKRPTTSARLLWFFLVMGLGNIGTALFVLDELTKLPKDASVNDLLTRQSHSLLASKA